MKDTTSIGQIVIPEISCPFPSQISSHYEAVKAHTLDWAQSFGLTQHEAALHYYRMADYPGLACRVYPKASLEELFLASDWLFLIFVFDDPFDEGGLDNRPEEMLAFLAHVLSVIHDPPLATPSGPIPEAFSDLFRRANSSLSPAWRRRFEQHHAEYFAAMRWQVANRERQRMPDTQAYLNNRAHAAGVLPAFDLIEIMQQTEIPPEIYESQPVQAILQAGNKIVGWTNDVHSFKKDAACGDVNSLLMAVQQEQNVSLQEAVNHVCAMIETETRHFQQMRHVLSSSADIDWYVGLLWVGVADWIRGHLDWYRGNRRYTEGSFDELGKGNSYLVDILAS